MSITWDPPTDRAWRPRKPPLPTSTPEDNTTMTETQLVALARELATIQDQIAGLQLRENDIKSRIIELVPGPDKYAAGDLTILVQTNTRFDQKKAEQAIPAELLPLVTVEKTIRTVDRKKVEVLAPDYLDACITHYDNKVILK